MLHPLFSIAASRPLDDVNEWNFPQQTENYFRDHTFYELFQVVVFFFWLLHIASNICNLLLVV